ncbi:MAG: F0F1 ATP synthase subunit B [Nitrospinae bacterium]|nr:F0F1 ATP synthase subunit B [Nitrospinota bacterium]
MPQFDTHFFSSLIFWEVVSFGILFWVLYKFALPPIVEALETRERKIRDSIEQAEQNRATAEQRLREYEAKLLGAAREVEAIMVEAKTKAQRLLEDNEQRLRAESARIREETTQEIERERRKALQEIRHKTADLAILVAEKVLARSLTDDDHRRLAEEALEAVGENPSKSQP